MTTSRVLALFLAFSFLLTSAHAADQRYFPPAGEWSKRPAADVGLDAATISEAVRFAMESESRNPRDLERSHYESFGREPFGDIVGPMKTRGEPTGIIIRKGYVVATWGEPDRADMTFSVTKSFLTTVAGLAFDRGLIPDVDEAVAERMAPVVFTVPPPRSEAGLAGRREPVDLFDTPRERTITWNHLLRQTSDWEGTLFGKPDWADRPDGDPSTWLTRERHVPGAVFEYNDVRVNLLALALLNVWRRPLPRVLDEEVMTPIGASRKWRWYGYDDSWVIVDGVAVQSVSGGGHWGGGMFLTAWDQARFGYLLLNRGMWGSKRILSERWLTMAEQPTEANRGYGFMNWFLNHDRSRLPSAPSSAVVHLGSGTNMIYVDRANDLVIVARWIERDAMDGLVKRVLDAIR